MSQAEGGMIEMSWIEERARGLREFFELQPDAELIPQGAGKFELRQELIEGLGHFNIEWHVIPAAEAVPLDEAYMSKLYPMAARHLAKSHEQGTSHLERIVEGHKQHQGRIIGIETTAKPHYLPGNRQFYGTVYGHDASTDPFAAYMGRAGMMNGTRYAHNYLSLRAFVRVVNEDWRARSILPEGYRVTVCPPVVFNLIGTIFHREWSETETLELGFYRDDEGNARCYAVGSSAPQDFSYINEVEGDTEWSLMGFRVALVPE